MTAKQQIRKALQELHEMAGLERRAGDDVPTRKVWGEVEAWIEGCARERKIDLRRTAAERIARQREIFNNK